MEDVFVVLLFFLTPVYGYFCYALFAPFYYMALAKEAMQNPQPILTTDDSSFSASMFLAMGDD
tara:strand:+ start:1940 stop:2128 length:189 start_codon:yes stop_codon:yes gene_type:complete